MSTSPPPVLVARNAMATRFEFALHGDRPASLRAAAEEALDEVERVENLLSLYRSHTDIARINAGASFGPVRVAQETFQLLERVREWSEQTDGAFDVTAGPLVRAWGFHGGTGGVPSARELEVARQCVGWNRLILHAGERSVRFTDPGGMLDLGAVGKGYALDRATDILRDAGVRSALLHGGTSTVVALGAPPGLEGWQVALPTEPGGRPGNGILLRDESLSVSAVWGRSFVDASGRCLGHVLDPRSGLPVSGTEMAAVALTSAAATDALSTALLVLGRSGPLRLAALFPGIRTWTIPEGQ